MNLCGAGLRKTLNGTLPILRVVRCLRRPAGSAALAVCLLGAPALAATERHPAPIDLANLVRTDPLGFTCIAEARLGAAFAATGKSGRLPRTCLPQPCDGAISRGELGALIGRPATQPEWDDYYARYAQVCRHEAIAFGTPGTGGSDPEASENAEIAAARDAAAFWAPILAPGQASAILSTETRDRTPAFATWPERPPLIAGGGNDAPTGTGPIGRLRPPESGAADPTAPSRSKTSPTTAPIVIPLPPAIALALCGIGLIAGARVARKAG